MAMKKEHAMLTLIIPGKYHVKDMDVYMEPLIDELRELWDGVNMLDVSRPINDRNFFFQAMLIWTIHDAPGLSICCGLETKGKHGCPSCGPKMLYRQSKDLNKTVYDEYRQYLPQNHRYRVLEKFKFNGKEVEMRKPRRMNPTRWKTMYDKKEGIGFPPGMKRQSIFYKLDYYENLPIAHLFDTMHIGKNVAECLWKHLNGTNLEAQIKLRKDLQVVSVMPNMWLHENNSYNHAPWTFTSKEKENIIDTMKSIRFPSGFGATLKNLFTRDGSEFSGLKTHDWHNWIKYVLSAAIPSTFDHDVRLTIYKLSKYLRYFESIIRTLP
ncbi:uncharacterized protein LOC131051993 [Cryptomeria japonica]|uniref:uncharacterized protein LOC131051993 n=1 Tax=Cryptomeria japonica TaxID=3369 RepID=UPI0027D9EA49|nr:uncharacterized protein LOC131051993 [Cryptomeria japonica]XP_057842573.2 uncharacterized protein LOC131051993 [Cryptomeria japonica]XP_057842574.2 uncharacterized protein LOC131051993 [Cryptomeria japonica]